MSLIEEALNKARKEIFENKEVFSQSFDFSSTSEKKKISIIYISVPIFLCIIILAVWWGWKKFKTQSSIISKSPVDVAAVIPEDALNIDTTKKVKEEVPKLTKADKIETQINSSTVVNHSPVKQSLAGTNKQIAINQSQTSVRRSAVVNIPLKKSLKKVSSQQKNKIVRNKSKILRKEKIQKVSKIKQKSQFDLRILLKKAYYQVEIGHLTEALSIYNQILNINPIHSEALINRGIIWQKLGNLQKAEKDLLLAYQYVPEDKILLNALGVNYLKQGQYEEAKKYFLKANNGTAMINLATMVWKLGKLKETEYYLKKAITLEPNNPYVYYYLGLFYQQQNTKKAKEYFSLSQKLALERADFSLLRSIEEQLSKY